jgi:hypothetical protein
MFNFISELFGRHLFRRDLMSVPSRDCRPVWHNPRHFIARGSCHFPNIHVGLPHSLHHEFDDVRNVRFDRGNVAMNNRHAGQVWAAGADQTAFMLFKLHPNDLY